jgi:hypothetical protein
MGVIVSYVELSLLTFEVPNVTLSLDVGVFFWILSFMLLAMSAGEESECKVPEDDESCSHAHTKASS